MTLDTRIPLMTAQPVAGVGNAIAAGFDEYHKAKNHKYQNKLLNLKTAAQNDNITRQNALLGISQDQNNRANEQHSFEMKAAEGAMIHRAFSGLSGLDPESRAAQIELMKPSLQKHGFDDDDWQQLATDEGLAMATQHFSQYAPVPSAQEALRREELNIKRERLDHDKKQAEIKLESLHKSVDALDMPDEDKKALKNLPESTLEKVVQKQFDPKTKADKEAVNKEAEQGKQSAMEVRNLAQELLNHPGRERASGFSSVFPSAPGGDARDFEIKLERLTSLMTLDNLGLMKGVLTDKDVQILRTAAAGLDVGQSEEALEGELNRIIKKIDKGLNQETTDKYSVGQIIEHNGQRYKVTGGDLNDPEVELVQ